MNSSDLLNALRLELADVTEPTLWSDAEIYGYIDESQKQFCRMVGGIGDGSSPLTQLSIAPVIQVAPAPPIAASEWVAISPLILKFRDAYRSADVRPVTIVNYEDMPAHGLRFNGRTAPHPDALVIGIEPGRARMYPAPNLLSTGVIQLIVDRLPLKSIDDSDQKLEIAEQHHINLLMWMKHRAFSKQDADTYDAKKSVDFGAAFREYCAEAKKEKERAMHKTRVVAYGGIGSDIGGRRGPHHWGHGSCRY